MDKYIRKIYEMLHSPIVTPYNLLENAKLDNYSYVNYYKGENGLIAEMKCITEDNVNAIFFYHFDSEDNLMKIFMKTGSTKELVFDRNDELVDLKQDYLNKLSEKFKDQVV